MQKIIIQKKYKMCLTMLLGVLFSALLIGVADALQGLALNDWSGIHPYKRIYNAPVLAVVGYLFGLVLLFAAKILKINLNLTIGKHFKLGLILGSFGVSGLLRPWFLGVNTEILMLIALPILATLYLKKAINCI